jgi:hypothetical protein
MPFLPPYREGLPAALSTYTQANLLAANTPESITVPKDETGQYANYVLFGKGQATTDNFYVQAFDTEGSADRVTNGTFASDTGWTKGGDWTIAAGVADCAAASNTDLSQTAAYPLVEGQAYYCTFTVTRAAGSIKLQLGGGTAGTDRSSSATFTEIIYAGTSQTILFDTTAFTGTIDNVTIIPCAAVPGDVTTGNAARQNPQGLWLNRNTVRLSIVSAATPIITSSFFK